MKIIISVLFIIVSQSLVMAQQSIILFDSLNYKGGKTVKTEANLTFEQGNILIAYTSEKSILDTLSNCRKLGVDKQKNEYYFINKPKNIIGIVMDEINLEYEVYCGRYYIVVFDKNSRYAKVLYSKNCGFDVVAFNNCGFYSFSYDYVNKQLFFTEKRLFFPNKKRVLCLKSISW